MLNLHGLKSAWPRSRSRSMKLYTSWNGDQVIRYRNLLASSCTIRLTACCPLHWPTSPTLICGGKGFSRVCVGYLIFLRLFRFSYVIYFLLGLFCFFMVGVFGVFLLVITALNPKISSDNFWFLTFFFLFSFVANKECPSNYLRWLANRHNIDHSYSIYNIHQSDGPGKRSRCIRRHRWVFSQCL